MSNIGGEMGERIYAAAEEMRDKAEKLRHRADRMEDYADNLRILAYEEGLLFSMEGVAKSKLAYETAVREGQDVLQITLAAAKLQQAILGLEVELNERKLDNFNVDIHRLSIGLFAINKYE